MNRLVKKALTLGTCVTAVLVAAEFLIALSETRRGAAEALAFFLTPGMALIEVFGAKHIDDVGFWFFAMLVNAVLYSFLCYALLWLFERLRALRGKG